MRTKLDKVGDACLVALVIVALCVGYLFVKISDTVFLRDKDYRHVRRTTASWYAGAGMVAASRCYAVGSWVRVTYRNASIVVQITSKGPAWTWFRRGRGIDLAREAFTWLENPRYGLIPVSIEACQPPAH